MALLLDDPLPPPVPPKDTPDRPTMDADRVITSTSASGSKRKRSTHDELVDSLHGSHLHTPGPAAHTPKRSRPSLQPSVNDASDDATPVQRRNVRRKKGVNNLSNLNLRHAAERQARLLAERQPVPRESRFQEGSLTDRPSNQPPSAFTRFFRTDSGNSLQVDELMDDYHNGMPSPHRSVEIDITQEKAQLPRPVAAIPSHAESTDENNGFLFRFGRSLAASFHPVRMWKQVWEETAEELRQKNLAEIERKRVLKEEAEKRYAQMKASGQFEPRVLSRVPAAEDNITYRDSQLIFASGPFESKRHVSEGSRLAIETNDASLSTENEVREPAPSVTKTFRSRLSFKRPSLQNLRFDLKRTKSDYTLAAAAANVQRDSSSSVSPVKMDVGDSALKKSHSKMDMRKQYKLSKRVSNLESKLELARRELDEALFQASPMPDLGSKYERFTPNSTTKRSAFVPGKLESLPSERILDPSQFDYETDELNKTTDNRTQVVNDFKGSSHEPPKIVDLLTANDVSEEDTIRVSRAKYPPRASSLFNLNNRNIESGDQEDMNNDYVEPTQDEFEDDNAGLDDSGVKNRETQKEINNSSKFKKASGFASLDAKLKALDANVNMASRRPTTRRKRKSGEDVKDYKPGFSEEDDDDLEWEEGVKAKRRKSSGASKKKTTSKTTTAKDEHGTQTTTQDVEENATESIEPSTSNENATPALQPRKSIDSQHAALDPVAEEENEGTPPLNGDPTKKSTHRATVSLTEMPQNVPEEGHAAAGAKKHHSHSPPTRKDAASASKSYGSRSVRGRGKKVHQVDPSFEWPEDVF